MAISLQVRTAQPEDLQSEVVEFLMRPESHGPDVTCVDHIETHISHVFLVGDDVYKLKKQVKLPYLDFSTLASRQSACVNEIHVNRRTAGQLYRGIIPVMRDGSGSLRIGGSGQLVDWLVRMRRFDQAMMLDHLADEGRLDAAMMESLADTIAQLHGSAEICRSRNQATDLEAVIDNNLACFESFENRIFPAEDIRTLSKRSADFFNDLLATLDQRRRNGFVRHGHGDLHLQNIVLIEGKPIPFDALEFNQKLATTDVHYDLAFLLMDLGLRNGRSLANVVLNRYIAGTGDVDGLGCLPLFLSLRAAVRAHVAAAQGEQQKSESRIQEAKRYFGAAAGHLNLTTPRLIAIGGLSGTGKSCLAARIAPSIGNFPGAYIARSDAIRKRLAGAALGERLPPSGYGARRTDQTYRQVYDEARQALAGGHAVIADAVFAKPVQRQAIEQVASDLGVPFRGVWLEAPKAALAERIAARKNDVSDATVSVLHQQLTYELGRIGWDRIVNDGTADEGAAKVAQALGLTPGFCGADNSSASG